MNVIYRIYKKLYALCYKEKITKTIKEQYICGISVKLTSDNNIDIICDLPPIHEIDNSNLIEISEKYAELLLLTNKGCFKRQIFEILVNHTKKNNSSTLTLFVENIISFYDLLNAEYKKIRKEKNNSNPMIRPTSVFKV